jgi:hypothetical protein
LPSKYKEARNMPNKKPSRLFVKNATFEAVCDFLWEKSLETNMYIVSDFKRPIFFVEGGRRKQ